MSDRAETGPVNLLPVQIVDRAMKQGLSALGVVQAIEARGYRLVGPEPTKEMWSGLARDIMTWARDMGHDGATLHFHLRELGHKIPNWLSTEIPDGKHVPPRGTIVAAIWKAMLAVAPTYGRPDHD